MDNKLHFDSDYMEGCAPEILERLSKINFEKNVGYGTDEYCESAKQKIRASCGLPNAEVRFLVGGTQTNTIVISGILRSWQGVISADTGHIAVHESGAIEATGHKVITLPHKDGKLEAAAVESYLKTFHTDANNEHMARPGMVYISHPTEYGTLYTKDELKNLKSVCKKIKIPLFIDGARLGYGLAAENDVTLRDIAKYSDVFYIGGTKVGALFGEAVVISNPDLIPHLTTTIKQHGGLLAKGWLLGVQFDTLFTDNLYMKISKNAIDMAMYLKTELKKKGIKLYNNSKTNQQFVIYENEKLKALSKKVGYGFWEKYDDTHTVIRLATSWATTREEIDKLLEILN